MDVLHQARLAGLPSDDHAWWLQRNLMEFLEGAWDQPDEGIWEVRGPRRHFTHSKVLAWVAFDRAVERSSAWDCPARSTAGGGSAQEIHDEVCREGFNAELNSFTQAYGSDELDASTLLIPLVGFLPPNDPRVVGTIDAIQRDLTRGRVRRALRTPRSDTTSTGSPAARAFPAVLVLARRCAAHARSAHDEARALFERLLGVRNDLGSALGGVRPAARGGCSATSRRRSRTSGSSTRRTTCRTTPGRCTSGRARRSTT